jgi:hypothetical protein
MATPDPLTLPSGGTVTFRDSATHFKRSHYKRLAAAVSMAADGTVSMSTRSEESWRVIDVMAEALVGSWHGDGSWYLDGQPVPGDDPSVMEAVSSVDLRALGGHLIPLAWDLLGLVVVKDGEDDDEGKGVPPSVASNGSTPTSGSGPSTPVATPAETPALPETTLSDALPSL